MYKGTFERRLEDAIRGPNAFRDWSVQFAKDAFRSVDFLESRSEIQSARLGYYGLSGGATMGALIVALEPRLKTAVFLGGGLYSDKVAPEADILNFAPRGGLPC